MKIHYKTGIVISISLIVLMLIFVAVSNETVLGGFSEVEEKNAASQIDELAYLLADEISIIDTAAAEWADQTETRDLVARTYVNHLPPPTFWSELDDETFMRLDLNYIILCDATGRIIAARGFDTQENIAAQIPSSLLDEIQPGQVLMTTAGSSAMGILSIPEGLLMVSSHPVMDADDTARIGVIVMGRYLGSATLDRLSQASDLTIELLGADDPSVRNVFSGAGSGSFMQTSAGTAVTVDAPVSILQQDEYTLAGYCLIRDISGDPLFMLKTELPRDIYAQGRESTLTLVMYMFGGFLVFAVLIVLLLERTVLSRLSFLSTGVNAIGSEKDSAARIKISGDDEISDLARAINWMLADMDESQLSLKDELSATEERYQLFFNSGSDMALVHTVDRDGSFGRFVAVNEMACRQLGYSRDELLTFTPRAIYPPAQMENFPNILREIRDRGRVLYETEFISKSGWVLPVEINAHFFAHMGWTAVLMTARDITERKETENLKKKAFCQIEKNMEQFAILNDHIRNPLQVIVGLSLLNAEDEEATERILEQAEIINRLVDQLDQGWIESEKIRDWLRKYYGFD